MFTLMLSAIKALQLTRRFLGRMKTICHQITVTAYVNRMAK
ncbi:hypothetical protein A359_02470 [secondary endosymbiont of Ctenarytaina eucalypti]|uniref:Uncharacterized protein n=1 Tax=secondary endosymbiont of Ctenarytaina eucalypti TaxID=1199245 RepID=J3YRG8_9ENTR|nr:hypothetical protein A359_02470 [secondary endosymbiont of Ctenarytaina eucalypti]